MAPTATTAPIWRDYDSIWWDIVIVYQTVSTADRETQFAREQDCDGSGEFDGEAAEKIGVDGV
jgi:hypothetical protein